MIPSSTVVTVPTNHSPIDVAATERAPQATVNSRSNLGSIANAVNMIGGTLLVGGFSTAVFGLSASTNGEPNLASTIAAYGGIGASIAGILALCCGNQLSRAEGGQERTIHVTFNPQVFRLGAETQPCTPAHASINQDIEQGTPAAPPNSSNPI